MEKSFTPPSLESQYNVIHVSNMPEGRIAEIQAAINEEGAYLGPVSRYDFGKMREGATQLEFADNTEYIKVMPTMVRVPANHPAYHREPAAALEKYSPLSQVGGGISSLRTLGFLDEIINGCLATPMGRHDERRQAQYHKAQRETQEKQQKQQRAEAAAAAVAELGTSNKDLADFLQVFADEADNTHIGYGKSKDYRPHMRDGGYGEHVRMVQNVGPRKTTYALSRCDVQLYRRPHAADEAYSITNMETGVELAFNYSNIAAIRQGDYDQFDWEGKLADGFTPADIAAIAGIGEDQYADDPITTLTRGGTLMIAELNTRKQLQRFDRLCGLGKAECLNAQVTFAPETMDEVMDVLTGYFSDNFLKRVHKIRLPEDMTPVSIILQQGSDYRLEHLLEGAAKLDEANQRTIFAAIQTISTRELNPGWDSYSPLYKLVTDAVKFNQEGGYTLRPSLELIKRLDCDRYDFVEALFKRAEGHYGEGSRINVRDPSKTVLHYQNFTINEDKARALAEIFEWQLMETVDVARDSYHIPDDIPPVEQIMELFRHQGFTEKGMRIVNRHPATQYRTDLTVANWGEICEVVSRCREQPISDEDRATIEKYRLPVDGIARIWKNAPGSTVEHVAEGLIQPRMLN